MNTTSPDSIQSAEQAYVSNLPAVPTAGQTVVLFATHPRPAGGSGAAVTSAFARANGLQPIVIATEAIAGINVTFHLHDHASAANGLRAYETIDGGTTWTETDMKGYVAGVANQPSIGSGAPIQVPALSAGQEWAEDFVIGRYRGFALEYTAGGTPPTAWSLTVAVKHAPVRD